MGTGTRRSSTSREAPRARGSALNRCFQYRQLTMATGSAPCRSSEDSSRRPSAGRTPSAWKKFPVTTSAVIGSSPVRDSVESGASPNRSENARLRSRYRGELARLKLFNGGGGGGGVSNEKKAPAVPARGRR